MEEDQIKTGFGDDQYVEKAISGRRVPISPSRTYVIACTKDSGGAYFRQFTLPAGVPNTAEHASWYFLNRLDLISCVSASYTVEDYRSLKEVGNDAAKTGSDVASDKSGQSEQLMLPDILRHD